MILNKKLKKKLIFRLKIVEKHVIAVENLELGHVQKQGEEVLNVKSELFYINQNLLKTQKF